MNADRMHFIVTIGHYWDMSVMGIMAHKKTHVLVIHTFKDVIGEGGIRTPGTPIRDTTV